MNCPNCGKEIEENQKFCTGCGAKISDLEKYEEQETNIEQEANTEKETNTENGLLKNKPLIISIAIVLVLAIVGTLTFVLSSNFNSGDGYKSIKTIKKSELDNMSARSALDLLIQQDADMTEYLNKPSHPKGDKIFETFYKNLLLFSGKETELTGKLWYEGEDSDNKPTDIEFRQNTINKGDYNITTVKLVNPKTELFSMLDEAEGAFMAGINYNYLANKYSEKLGDVWKEFLAIKQREFNDLDGVTYYIDNYPPAQNKIINRYLDEAKFIKKYPDFVMNDVIRNDIKIYASDITGRTDILDLIFNSDYTAKTNKLSPEVRKAYERFINEADTDTYEYKFIKKLYDAMKKDNFVYRMDLYKVLIDITGKQEYEDWYGSRIEEAKKQEAIDEYQNYSFEKREAYLVYEEAFEICKEEIEKTQNPGTGALFGCVQGYFDKYYPKLSKLYQLVDNYCHYTTDCDADKRNCVDTEFKSFNSY